MLLWYLSRHALTGRNCFVGRIGAMWLAKEAAPRCAKRHCDLNAKLTPELMATVSFVCPQHDYAL